MMLKAIMTVLLTAPCVLLDQAGYVIQDVPLISGARPSIEALSRSGSRAILLTEQNVLYAWDIDNERLQKVHELGDVKAVLVAGFLDDDRFVVTVDRRRIVLLNISGGVMDLPGPTGPYKYFGVHRCAGRFAIGFAEDEEANETVSVVWDTDQRHVALLEIDDDRTDGQPLAHGVNANGELAGVLGRNGFYKLGEVETLVTPDPPSRYCLFERIGASGRVGGVLDGRVPFLWTRETGYVRLSCGSSIPEITRIYDINDCDLVLGSLKGTATNDLQQAVIWNGQEPDAQFEILADQVTGLNEGDYLSAGRQLSNDGKVLVTGMFQGQFGSRLLVPLKKVK